MVAASPVLNDINAFSFSGAPRYPVVPISQSALFYESLRRHGVKSKFIVSNVGVHDVRSLDDLEVIRKQIFDFLKEFGF